MLLGQVLERLGDETFAAETLVSLNDLALMVQVEAAAGSSARTSASMPPAHRAASPTTPRTRIGSPS